MPHSQRLDSGRRDVSFRPSAHAFTDLHGSLLEVLPQPAAFLSETGTILASNRSFSDRLGGQDEGVAGKVLSALLSPASWRRCQLALTAAASGTPARIRSRLLMPSGRCLGSQANCIPLLHESELGLFLFQLEGASNALPQADGPWIQFPHDLLVFGFADDLAVIRDRLEVAAEGRIDLAELQRKLADCRTGDIQTLRVTAAEPKAGDDPVTVRKITEIRLVPLADYSLEPAGVMAIVRRNFDCPLEVAENKWLACQDALTGLSSRRAFLLRLQDHLIRLRELGTGGLAVFFIDLDGFNTVNDLGGYEAGDDLPLQVSAALQSCFSDLGCLGRIGGDACATMCSAVGEDEVLDRADRILEALSRIRLEVGNGIFTISGSIGIAFLPGESVDERVNPEYLLRLAETACLRSKRAEGRSIHLERVELEEPSSEGASKETIPEPANLKTSELALFSMPIRYLDDGRPCGSEILLRLRGRQSESCSPRALISTAEQSGFIAQLESWTVDKVLDAACAPGGRSLLSVNVSADSAQSPVFRDVLRSRLVGDPLLASRLCLEIAERDFLRDPATVELFFRFLTELGCQTAIDDFAGHWPVLARLTDVKVDWIKLDASLTRMVSKSPAKALVVKRLINTAHDLGIKVIAKHVETAEEVEVLHDLKIDAAQGFYFGKPTVWFEA